MQGLQYGCVRFSAITHVSELHHADLPQLADTAVGRLGLQEELGQSHLLAAEQLPHDAALALTPPPQPENT